MQLEGQKLMRFCMSAAKQRAMRAPNLDRARTALRNAKLKLAAKAGPVERGLPVGMGFVFCAGRPVDESDAVESLRAGKQVTVQLLRYTQTYAAKNWAEEDKFDTELIAQTVAKLRVTSAEHMKSARS